MNSKKGRNNKLKPIPKFKSDLEEAKFWDTHDLTEYFDFSKGYWGRLEFADNVEIVRAGNTKKSESVTIRFQSDLMKKLKEYAGSLGLSVSSLIRMWSIEKFASTSSK